MFLAVAAMISLFSAGLVADDKPSANTPESRPGSSQNKTWGVDEIMSFFQKGIVPKSAKGKHNKIYTVSEILAKFGEPRQRSTSGNDETWFYKCKDGSVAVQFRSAGYGGSSDAKSLRLEIRSLDPTRAKKSLEPSPEQSRGKKTSSSW
jgi:hypothetical protein